MPWWGDLSGTLVAGEVKVPRTWSETEAGIEFQDRILRFPFDVFDVGGHSHGEDLDMIDHSSLSLAMVLGRISHFQYSSGQCMRKPAQYLVRS